MIKSRAVARLNRKGNLSNSKAALGLVAEEGDSNPETLAGLTAFKVGDCAPARLSELLRTKDVVRLALNGLGTDFSVLG